MVNAEPPKFGFNRPHLIKEMLTMSLFLNHISLLHLIRLKYFRFKCSQGVDDTLPSSQMYCGKTE